MKQLLILTIIFIGLNSCKKSDGNTAPVIKFKSITSTQKAIDDGPYLSVKIKDEDGDLGLSGNDSSFVFIKNVSNPPFKMDSFAFPSNVPTVGIKNIEFELETNLKLSAPGNSILGPRLRAGQGKDTMFFEVYVKDFKRNKSNVIKTDDPLYFIY